MSVLENLICPRIRRHCLFETQGPVNVLGRLTGSTPLQKVGIGHYRSDAGLAIELWIENWPIRIHNRKHVGCLKATALSRQCSNSAEKIFAVYLKGQNGI